VRDWKDLKAFADVAQTAIAKEAGQRRAADSLFDEDLVKSYKVEQQSRRSNPDSHYENSFEPIGNSLRRIFTNTELDDPFSQTDQVAWPLVTHSSHNNVDTSMIYFRAMMWARLQKLCTE
jgi:hypothetical protein